MSRGSRQQPDPSEDLREENAVENASSTKSTIKIVVWTLIVCASLVGGVVAGLWFQTTPEDPKIPAASRQNSALITPLPDLTVAQALDAAHRALRLEGNPELALRLYRRAIGEMTRPPLRVLFEQAVCYELLGQFNKAREVYHQLSTVNNQDDDTRLQLGVELGLARTLQALGDHNAAASILYELSVDPRLVQHSWAAGEAAFGLSRALTEHLLNTPDEMLLVDSVVAPPVYQFTGEQLMQAVETAAYVPNDRIEDPDAPFGTATPTGASTSFGGSTNFGTSSGVFDSPSSFGSPYGATSAYGSQSPSSMTYGVRPTAADSQMQSSKRPEPGVKVLYKVSNRPEEVQLAVRLGSVPAMPMTDSLLDVAGLRPIWTKSARTAMLGRTVAVESANISLASLLDAVLSRYGVIWIENEAAGTITFRLHAEMPENDQMAWAHAVAVRATRRAVADYPDHPHVPLALLTVGNLHALEREFPAAHAQYELLLRRHGQTDTASRAWFNLAKTHLLAGEVDAAVGAFYRVVDGLRGGELRAIAALYVGRLRLEREELTEAKRAFDRSRKMSQVSVVRAAAGLLLSATYLRNGNPHAANLTLLENRADIALHRKGAGALLSAMARFQTANTDEARSIHGRALVGALSQVKPADFFGKYGAVIIGEAYAELGLQDEMGAAYELALAGGIQGATAQRMKLALARLHQSRGEVANARMMLQQVNAVGSSIDSTVPSDSTHIDARISEAELEFSERRNEVCLSICRQLLQQPLTEERKAEILRLMGKTYRRMQDHQRAALCFSGLIPEP